MSAQPRCEWCGAGLVAGNQVARLTFAEGHQVWSNAACERRLEVLHETYPGSVLERGRLVIVTEFRLDTEIAREKDKTP